MKDPLDALVEEYTSALQNYLGGAGEAALQQAYELGRKALADGLGILDMSAVQHRALVKGFLRAGTPKEGARTLKAAKHFFAEFVSPFEMAHRGFREANTALHRLNETLEEQAKRIAHALHDEAGQLLASVHIAMRDIAREIAPPARDRLMEVHGLLDQIEEQLRCFSHELRPTILDDLGLLPALEFLADSVSRRTGLPVSVEGSTEGRPPPAVETALYRCVQEALTNVVKHAQASRATVQLQREPKQIHCSVRDNGVGFDVPAVLAGPGQPELFGRGPRRGERGLGLIGIRERLSAIGGMVQITSTPGRGTELLITVPLET
ncbi:MAG: ATP-binding protein [candidate division NC10 bacterium]|nr:ATP-binding protein [candidate division NC10 bacterium]